MTKPIAPITVQPLKPRNPFVAAAYLRRAGSHRGGAGALRRQAQGNLQRELEHCRSDSP